MKNPTATFLTEKELLDDLANRGRGPVFPYALSVIRKRRNPGETKSAAAARWEREAQLEEDRDREARRVFTGQVLPVYNEDDLS